MDYYQTLGISKDASTKEIKTAYRKLAFKYHPDKNKEGNSEEKFKQIVNAYSILSNDDKRKNYDMGNLDGIFRILILKRFINHLLICLQIFQ